LRARSDQRRHRWIAAIFGALAAPVLTSVLATIGLGAYWLVVCFADDGVCDDPMRVLKWSVLHGLLIGAHAIVVGGSVGFLAVALRGWITDRRAVTAIGAAVGSTAGGLVGFEFWTAMGGKAPLGVAIVVHGIVGALIASMSADVVRGILQRR
jgi:hypothetical protein